MKSKPRLFKTKRGARYIKYNGRKYRINSTVSDRYIIKKIFDIIKQLIKHRKRRASRKTTTNTKQEHKQPTISGSVDVGNICIQICSIICLIIIITIITFIFQQFHLVTNLLCCKF